MGRGSRLLLALAALLASCVEKNPDFDPNWLKDFDRDAGVVVVRDLLAGADLAIARDLPAPDLEATDLAELPDLVPPPDLVVVPDLLLNCEQTCALEHATAACVNGTCTVVACDSYFADCDRLAANGCEVDTNSDVNNCGNCRAECSATHLVSPMCTNGECNGPCAPGFADCNGNRMTDGCEADLLTDPLHCGSCAGSCSTSNVPSPTCSAGVCSGRCKSGFADCNNNKLSDGCEALLATDPNNCGGCGHACPVGQACVNGVCP